MMKSLVPFVEEERLNTYWPGLAHVSTTKLKSTNYDIRSWWQFNVKNAVISKLLSLCYRTDSAKFWEDVNVRWP